jgi:Raf kinase inhibitor-like YbhB/YbcL family protein
LFKEIVTFTLAASLAGSAMAADFQVQSEDVKEGRFTSAQMANSFGCSGDNISPRLTWTGAPADAKSFVVTIYDPDAPTGSGWWHWVVANIPADARELPRNASADSTKLPAGALQVNNDTGRPAYLGPCPPVGKDHHYQITVHALKLEKLQLAPTATPALVGFMAGMNSIGKASLTILGGR